MKAISIEFNELSPVLLDRFIGRGDLPNFARFRSESFSCITDAGEDEEDNLEPWIQWVTAHTGLPLGEHKAFHLGDGPRCDAPRVWDALSAAGKKVWVCGSMNGHRTGELLGWFLPDPWTMDAKASPAELAPYLRFVQASVQEHSRGSAPLRAGDVAAFAFFMATHGLSAATVAAGLRQAAEERLRGARWKRAAFLDRLQFDVFRHGWRRLKPDFATFFSNSTAHYQHHYWRHMEPEAFRSPPPEGERARYGGAVFHGYREMDRLLGRFFDLAGSDTTLILSTGLSQAPGMLYEESGGMVVYRPRDFEAVIAFAGVIAPHTVTPVMADRFRVRFESEAEARAAEDLFARMKAGERDAMKVSRRGDEVFLGCAFAAPWPDDLTLRSAGGVSRRFGDLFYKVFSEGAVRSGMHHRDGVLWIRKPGARGDAGLAGKRAAGKVPLTSFAPTLLRLFGVAAPEGMRGEALEV